MSTLQVAHRAVVLLRRLEGGITKLAGKERTADLAHLNLANAPLPRRAIGDRELFPIPVDIYLLIFAYFDETDDICSSVWLKKTWASLTVVCRYFYATFIPLLFGAIYYNPSEIQNGSSKHPIVRFCNSMLARNPSAIRLAQHITHCEVARGAVDIQSSLFLNSMHHMKNINTLIIDTPNVDGVMLEAIASLTNLTTLKFANRRWLFSSDVTVARVSRLSNLEKLTCLTLFGGCTYNLPQRKTLESSFFSWKLTDVAVDDENMVLAYLSHGNHESLRGLEVHIRTDRVIAPLEQFLKATHSITRLSIRTDETPTSRLQPLRLHQSSLPHLEELRCPATLSAHLTTGRQFRSLKIEYAPEQALAHVRLAMLSAVPSSPCIDASAHTIQFLSIPAAFYHFLVKSDQHSHITVEHLELSDFDPLMAAARLPATINDNLAAESDAYLTSIFAHFDGLISSRVHVLDLRRCGSGLYLLGMDPEWDLPRQYDYITKVVLGVFPSLRRVRITRWIGWERDESGCWHPFMFSHESEGWNGTAARSFRDEVDYMTNEGIREGKVKDWKGTLAAFFPSNDPIHIWLTQYI